MAKTIATLLGVVLLLVGIIGLFTDNFLGTHLTGAHDAVHLLTGAISLFIGLRASLAGARTFCIVFGLVYLLLGVIGFALGDGPDRMFNVGTLLTLGTMDHVIHILLGVVYLIGGFLTKAVIDRNDHHD
jgi:Domain of unknown function (DUF4383)